MILLGWGVVQVGLSFQSHDPSQRSQGFLTLAGGLVITFAKEILDPVSYTHLTKNRLSGKGQPVPVKRRFCNSG